MGWEDLGLMDFLRFLKIVIININLFKYLSTFIISRKKNCLTYFLKLFLR